MKWHNIFVLIFSILIISQIGYGQDYFPLQVGNVWYYGPTPFGSAWYYGPAPYFIEEIVIIDNVEYSKYCIPVHCYYFRKDSLGNVYMKYEEDEEEFLRYKLDAEIGETWIYELRNIEVTLESKTDTVIIQDTILYNCYRFHFERSYPYNSDSEENIWLAPDIGKVKSEILGWGDNKAHLKKAIVNGRRIPEHTIPPEVIETIPYDGQSNIPIDADITLKFNFGIQPNFINSDYIKVAAGNKYYTLEGIFEDTYTYSSHRIKFIPDIPFSYQDTIFVTISSEVEDYTGDHLTEDYEFFFITEKEVEEPLLFMKDTVSTSLTWGDFDFGDYDNDGDEDLIIIGGFHYIELYEYIDNKFEIVESDFIPLDALLGKRCIQWVDYNNDNLLDVVYAGEDSSNRDLTLFYKNTGTDFILEQTPRLYFSSASMDWADYDLDGFKDLAIWGLSDQIHGAHAAIYKNIYGNMIKQEIEDLPIGVSGVIKWVDYDNDHAMDFITVNDQLKYMGFYKNTDNEFHKTDLELPYKNWLSYRYDIDYTDLDNDGDIDLLMGSYLLIRDGDSFILDTEQIDLDNGFVKFNDFDSDNDEDLYIVGHKEDPIQRTRTYIQIYENIDGRLSLWKEIAFNKYVTIFSALWKDITNDYKIDLTMMTYDGLVIYYNIMKCFSGGEGYLPCQFKLYQNFPNPFNLTTMIRYTLPSPSFVSLVIYDLLGREVRTLVKGNQDEGFKSILWDGTTNSGERVSSNIYIYQLRTKQSTQTRKMVLLQ